MSYIPAYTHEAQARGDIHFEEGRVYALGVYAGGIRYVMMNHKKGFLSILRSFKSVKN